MLFPKSFFASSAILLLLTSLPAFGQSSTSWKFVRLGDQVNGRLTCRTQPNSKASVVRTFRHGALVKTGSQKGSFTNVVTVAGERQNSSNCWVSRNYTYNLPSGVRGKVYQGNYRYLGNQPLKCRRAVGYNTPATKVAYYMKARIEATGVKIDNNGQTWFSTRDNCFIPALNDQLRWDDRGEDPNAMCNFLKEPC